MLERARRYRHSSSGVAGGTLRSCAKAERVRAVTERRLWMRMLGRGGGGGERLSEQWSVCVRASEREEVCVKEREREKCERVAARQ